MICYKCDMCLTVHDSVGEMTNLVFSHAGTSSVNFPKNGKFHLCNECKSKLLNNLHAFSDMESDKKIKMIPDYMPDNIPAPTPAIPEYINEDAKKHFKGKCPYTDKKCEDWRCQDCEVEAAERKYMENDSEE